MDSRMLTAVTRLDGQNYHDWKFAVSMLMRAKGCWEVVSGAALKPEGDTKDWERKAEEGMTIIALTVQPNQYTYIRDCTSGPEAWKALQNAYERNSRATRIALKRQFYGFDHNADEPMESYVNGITDLAAKLRAIGIALLDEDVTDVLIFNLDDKYSGIASTLVATKDELKITDVTSTLLEEERRMGGPPVPEVGTSLVTYPTGPKGRGRICYRCGRNGHIMRDCHAVKHIDGKPITKEIEQEAVEKLKSHTEKSSYAREICASLNDFAY
jgi:hypothetical protein